MALKDLFKRMAPTRTLAKTDGLEIVGFKYTPHLIIAMIALVGLYYVMGWQLP